MKIFASWSGQPSREIAELLREWLPNVVQSAQVYVSSQDIAKGERWLSNLASNLEEINFGVVVVTKTNVVAPWLMFEAGALSKLLSTGGVVPLLCGVTELEAVRNPLFQFQYSHFNEEGLRDLVMAINMRSERPLEERRMTSIFEKWWPDLAKDFEAIKLPEDEQPKGKKPAEAERLANIENALEEIIMEQRRQRRRSSNSPVIAPALATASQSRELLEAYGRRSAAQAMMSHAEIQDWIARTSKYGDQKVFDADVKPEKDA